MFSDNLKHKLETEIKSEDAKKTKLEKKIENLRVKIGILNLKVLFQKVEVKHIGREARRMFVRCNSTYPAERQIGEY